MHRPLVRPLAACLLVPFVVASLPSIAAAQSDKPAAEILLKQGLDLEAAGKLPEACAKLEGSLQLYPSLNTEYHLADCFEKIGKTASAWFDFNEVADKAHAAGESAKEAKARERAAAIASKVSHLTVVVTGETAGLEIKRDGVSINKATWGTQLPIDAGEYAIEASAAGKEPFRTKITVKRDGDDVKLEIPALGEAKAGTATTTATTTTTVAPTTATTAASGQPTTDAGNTSSGGGSGRKTLGLVVAGAGVVAMGVGGILGLSAKSKYDGASCTGNLCDGPGLQTRDDARSKGNLATVVFAVGAAALIGGGVLWLTAPSGEPTAAQGSAPKVTAGLTLGGVVVGGSF
ncbi:MAG: hypothetical protein NVS3B10_15270 [Polyangiales bacterium]